MCTKSTHGIRSILTELVLILMGISDLKTMKVPNGYQILLLIVVLISMPIVIYNLIAGILFMIIGFIASNMKKQYVGGADFKIISILLVGYGSQVIEITFFASLFGLIYCLLTQKKKIPFVPFIAIGATLVII